MDYNTFEAYADRKIRVLELEQELELIKVELANERIERKRFEDMPKVKDNCMLSYDKNSVFTQSNCEKAMVEYLKLLEEQPDGNT